MLATHRNLHERVQQGLFRHDLYYRLVTHRVQLPPLRERREDIPLLAEIFLDEAAALLGKKPPLLTPACCALLAQQRFDGNIRELKALITDAVARSSGDTLTLDLPGLSCSTFSSKTLPAGEPPLPTLKQMEQQLIAQALKRAGNNQGLAAKLLGISRTALNKRLAKQKNT